MHLWIVASNCACGHNTTIHDSINSPKCYWNQFLKTPCPAAEVHTRRPAEKRPQMQIASRAILTIRNRGRATHLISFHFLVCWKITCARASDSNRPPFTRSTARAWFHSFGRHLPVASLRSGVTHILIDGHFTRIRCGMWSAVGPCGERNKNMHIYHFDRREIGIATPFPLLERFLHASDRTSISQVNVREINAVI